MSKKIIGSHEFLSKTVLNNFAIDTSSSPKFVAYVYSSGKRVHTANTKTFNVKDGAYTSANETIMSSEFESYLGDLQKTITKSLRSGGKLLAKDFDIDKIKKYFAYQCMRDLRVMEGIQRQQEKLSKIPGFPVDYLERSENTYEMRNTYISREPEECLFQNVFRNYALVVAIDPTGRLVGSNCIVTLSENGGYDTLGIALSPNTIFILTERYDKYPLLHYTHFAWKTLSQRDVDFTNQRTLKTSILRGGEIIISNSKEHLQELVDRSNPQPSNNTLNPHPSNSQAPSCGTLPITQCKVY